MALECVVIDEQECPLCPICEGVLRIFLNPYNKSRSKAKWQMRTRCSRNKSEGSLAIRSEALEWKKRKVDTRY